MKISKSSSLGSTRQTFKTNTCRYKILYMKLKTWSAIKLVTEEYAKASHPLLHECSGEKSSQGHRVESSCWFRRELKDNNNLFYEIVYNWPLLVFCAGNWKEKYCFYCRRDNKVSRALALPTDGPYLIHIIIYVWSPEDLMDWSLSTEPKARPEHHRSHPQKRKFFQVILG